VKPFVKRQKNDAADAEAIAEAAACAAMRFVPIKSGRASSPESVSSAPRGGNAVRGGALDGCAGAVPLRGHRSGRAGQAGTPQGLGQARPPLHASHSGQGEGGAGPSRRSRVAPDKPQREIGPTKRECILTAGAPSIFVKLAAARIWISFSSR